MTLSLKANRNIVPISVLLKLHFLAVDPRLREIFFCKIDECELMNPWALWHR